jgi:hypothetical protein
LKAHNVDVQYTWITFLRIRDSVMRLYGTNRINETIMQNIQLMCNIKQAESVIMKAQRELKGNFELKPWGTGQVRSGQVVLVTVRQGG